MKILALGVVLVLSLATSGYGQQIEFSRQEVVSVIVRDVLRDPTTYLPTIINDRAWRLDWDTSQSLFAHDWLEKNPEFTVDHASPGKPIGYEAGNIKITAYAFRQLGLSFTTNLLVGLIERPLLRKYPDHKRLISVLMKLGKGSLASYYTYSVSAPHLRQWRENERMYRELESQPPTK